MVVCPVQAWIRVVAIDQLSGTRRLRGVQASTRRTSARHATEELSLSAVNQENGRDSSVRWRVAWASHACLSQGLSTPPPRLNRAWNCRFFRVQLENDLRANLRAQLRMWQEQLTANETLLKEHRDASEPVRVSLPCQLHSSCARVRCIRRPPARALAARRRFAPGIRASLRLRRVVRRRGDSTPVFS